VLASYGAAVCVLGIVGITIVWVSLAPLIWHSGRPDALFGLLAIILGGLSVALIYLGGKSMKEGKEIDTGVPLTRANAAHLPAADSLVRASSEPAQEQERVLLRAAGQGPETSPEQLLRATQERLLLPEEFEALVARLESNIRRVQSGTRLAIRMNIAFTCVGLLWWSSGADVFGGTLFSFVLALLLTTHLKARKICSFDDAAERLVEFIAHLQGIAHLRILLDLCIADGSLGVIWDKVTWEANAAVVRLLPLIKPTDAEIFNTQHRAHLRHGLFHHSFGDMGSWRGDGYCLMVLTALEQIGDKRDLRDVEQIMKEPYVSGEVRLAAQRCAQTIARRILHEGHKDLLLRPSLEPAAGDTLLRPAGERADTPPQQLLRAASADDPDIPA
jgi:hypothetical protein